MKKKIEILVMVLVLVIGILCLSKCMFGKKYTVTFKTNGGSEVENVLVRSGSSIEEPDEPKKKGYEFLGWYLNGKEYDFDEEVDEDITLVAKWSKVESSDKEEKEETTTTKPTTTTTKTTKKAKTSKKTKTTKSVTTTKKVTTTAKVNKLNNTTPTEQEEPVKPSSPVTPDDNNDDNNDNNPEPPVVNNKINITKENNTIKISKESLTTNLITTIPDDVVNELFTENIVVKNDKNETNSINKVVNDLVITTSDDYNYLVLIKDDKGYTLTCENDLWYLDEAYVKTSDNYYKTIEDALLISDSIELLNNITVPSTIILNKTTTINGNNYMLTKEEGTLFKLDDNIAEDSIINIKNIQTKSEYFMDINGKTIASIKIDDSTINYKNDVLSEEVLFVEYNNTNKVNY